MSLSGWQLYTRLVVDPPSGIKSLWMWRHTALDGSVTVCENGYSTMQACVADARIHGLTGDPVITLDSIYSRNVV